MYQVKQQTIHNFGIVFQIEDSTIRDYAASIPVVKPRKFLHITAGLIDEQHKGIIRAAFADTPANFFYAELGKAEIFRQRALVIPLADPTPVHNFQRDLVERIQHYAQQMVSDAYAKRLMDRMTKNRSMTIHPHITVGNVAELDIPATPLKDFTGITIPVDRIVLDVNYDASQRMVRDLTTSRASAAPQARRSP